MNIRAQNLIFASLILGMIISLSSLVSVRLSVGPPGVKELREEGIQYLEEGRYAHAALIFSRLLTLDESNKETLRLLSESIELEKRGPRLEEAENSLTK